MQAKVRKLRFDISSYWRVGSGKGSDAIADAMILRDSNGLPHIPGKAIKGLLRDAMTLASVSGAVASSQIEKWFGSALAGFDEHANSGDDQERILEEGRFKSSEGCLWFGSAKLSKEWQDWASAASDEDKKDVLAALVVLQASTAIDRDGVAKEHSLRTAEAAVPMTLTAELRGPSDDEQWVKDVKACLPLIRALGSNRNRGLGRVQISLEEAK